MQHAFEAGTMVALMAAIIGVFVVARGLSFISHTLSHIGFSGAALSVLLGWNLVAGLALFTTVSGLAIGQLGMKTFRRDVVTGVVLSFFLGLGVLFLHLSQQQSTEVTALLFGNVVGISPEEVGWISGISAMVILVTILSLRWLQFDSFDPEGARASGLPVRAISLGFLLLMSLAVVGSVLVVGALLVFTLMICPAAAARHLTHRVRGMILLSCLFAVIGVWGGLLFAYMTDQPPSFFITTIETGVYLASLGWEWRRMRTSRRAAEFNIVE